MLLESCCPVLNLASRYLLHQELCLASLILPCFYLLTVLLSLSLSQTALDYACIWSPAAI